VTLRKRRRDQGAGGAATTHSTGGWLGKNACFAAMFDAETAWFGPL